MNVGDKFYYINRKSNAYNRKKIQREIDGETWFKYTPVLYTYEIREVIIKGKAYVRGEGELLPGESSLLEYSPEYHVVDRHASSFESRKEVMCQEQIEVLQRENLFFFTYEEALAQKKHLEREQDVR